MLTESQQRLRIGVVSFFDLTDKSAASGTPYRIAEGLQHHCGDVVNLSPVAIPTAPLSKRVFWRWEKVLTGRRPRWKSSDPCCRRMAEVLDRRLKDQPCDILFSAFAAWAVALSQADIPHVECTDSTMPLIQQLGWYTSVAGVSERSLRETRRLESHLLNRAVACVVSSTWCSEGMQRDYGVDPDRLFVVPLGANLDRDDVPTRQQALDRPRGRCRLLFLGVQWDRKGGPIALEAMDELASMGIDAELVIVGCRPAAAAGRPDVTIEGFLNKNEPAGRQRLKELLLSANFLFVPTRAEAYGIMYCEGNAYGLPAIGTAVGGVTEVIRDGRNGLALPLDAGGSAYARCIAEVYSDPEQYAELVRSSREEFEARLNWDAWGRIVAEGMKRALPAALASRVGPQEVP